MKRTSFFSCVVVGLSTLGCGGPGETSKPVVLLPSASKDTIQNSNPTKEAKSLTVDQPKKEATSPVNNPQKEVKSPANNPTKEAKSPANTPTKEVKRPPKAKPQSGSLAKRPSSEGKVLLTPSDFTFVGSYTFSAEMQATFGMGLTHHRVDGQLRFLTVSYDGPSKARLIEFALPADMGQKITTLTGSWADIWSPKPAPAIGAGDEYGLWMETLPGGSERLWTTHGTDYPSDGAKPGQSLYPLGVAVRILKSDGKITGLAGEYGFAGVSPRAIYGGVQPIPQWFRRKYSISQPYAVGWGGYASRMVGGSACSLGLMALAIPELAKYPADTVLPSKDFKIMADHRSGTTNARDWYAAGKPTSFDRGRRNADVENLYDSATGTMQWRSPAPDGFGRFVWGDSYYNTGCWIDGPKGGFLVIGSFSKGKAFYQDSTLNNSGRHAELQIFDPNDFGKVLQGKKESLAVQPVASKLLTNDLTPLGLLYPYKGNNPFGAIGGATFDAETGHLYLWCPGVGGGYECRLVVYKVNF